MGRLDMHFHLLPGVDDGPGDVEGSLELAAAALADGTVRVIATPHVRPEFVTDVGALPARVRELQDRLAREGLPLTLECGGELGHEMVGRLGHRELETIAFGPLGVRWILLETPFEGLDAGFHLAADELRARGFGVVLAHPERAAGILDHGAPGLCRELARGSVLQVNVWSLLGGYSLESKAAGERLVGLGLAATLATDAHPGWRRPHLQAGLEAAARLNPALDLGRRTTVGIDHLSGLFARQRRMPERQLGDYRAKLSAAPEPVTPPAERAA
jgi:protein-tyrosine phosphatase